VTATRTGLERFETSPVRPEFLSEQLQTNGGYTPLDPNSLPASGHSQYYSAGTESLDNLSSIVAGQYRFLTFATTLPNPTPGPVPTP
jgi:hypothetical protein